MSQPEPQQQSVARAIRPLWNQVYLPNLLMATGQGAMLPILIYAAKHLHASEAVATAIVAVNGFGTMAFDLPSGRIVARFGERRSALIATVLIVVGLLGCLAARSVPLLAASVFVQAAGWSLWALVRMTHLTRVAVTFARGRALSLFGGVIRLGNVLGPLVFVAIAPRGDTAPAFTIYLICVVVGFLWSALAQDREDHGAVAAPRDRVPVRKLLREHRRGLAISGTGAVAISLLRASRVAMVPLWAAHIGLDASAASAIYGLSSLIEVVFFYMAGVISDRYGRRMVALPCLILLSVGHLLLPLSHDYTELLLVALVLGFGNATGSGIILTLGADLTPAAGRASFLSLWRVMTDGGTSIGPLFDSAIIGIASIVLVGPVVGLVGLACAGVLARWLQEPSHLRRGEAGGEAQLTESSSP